MSKSVQVLLFGLIFYADLTFSLSSWDFMVTSNSKILFFDEHWQEVTSSAHQFDQLSAITFDETEEIVYFNDQLHNNGSIFSLKIPTSQDDPHIIEKIVQRTQNESIRSIAYDPLNRNLFWADAFKRKIYFAPIDTAQGGESSLLLEPKVLIDFANEETIPDGLALDVCRRKLYWTNSNFKNATVECIGLDGTGREVLVNSELFLPHGIVVDQLTDRIYWVVDQQGVHFSVESANLDGSDRHVIVRGLNNVPTSLAVTKDAIFWTDLTHNAVWTHAKYVPKLTSAAENATLNGDQAVVAATLTTEPHLVLTFPEPTRGIVARTRFFTLQNDQHCRDVVLKIRERLLRPRTTKNPIDTQIAKLQRDYCLNGGDYIPDSGICICKIGYKGARCESNECHNFCVHGSCAMSSMGFPKCVCQHGFYGERCQLYRCSDYCMNDGLCRLESTGQPSCECVSNFGGPRCEHNNTDICALFCRLLKHEPDAYVPFGCHDICEELSEQSEDGASIYAIPRYQHLEVCHNTNIWTSSVIIVLTTSVVICLVLLNLIIYGLRRFYKPARPRIKKTFVVRRQAPAANDTPLTNRPMATESCEITIENCCNMKICETPCLPEGLLQPRDANTKEDKKMLIHNMEDELY